MLMPAVKQLLPPGASQHGSHGAHILQMLSRQEAILLQLRSACQIEVTCLPCGQGEWASFLIWAPGSPTRSLAVGVTSILSLALFHNMGRGITDVASLRVKNLSSMKTLLFLPPEPARIRWGCWTKDLQQFCWEHRQRQGYGTQELQVFNTSTSEEPAKPAASLTRPYLLPAAKPCVEIGMLLVQLPAHVAALDMQTLEEQFCAYPPSGMDRAFGNTTCPLQCVWSPGGGSFSVAWGTPAPDNNKRVNGGLFTGVSVHDTCSQRCLALACPFADRTGVHVFLTWSPTASHLFIQVFTDNHPGCSDGIALMDMTGSCHVLQELHDSKVQLVAGFSSCGRFLHAATEPTPYLNEEDLPFTIRGFIYDVQSTQKLFHWEHSVDDDVDCQNEFIWASAANACYLQSCSTVLSWPSADCNVPEIARLWSHSKSGPAVLSPCGKLHVSTQTPCALYTTLGHDVDITHSSAMPPSHQLWHSSVTPGASTCEAHIAAESEHQFQLGSIAWHPNPAGGCLYAIMNAGGDLLIIDGRQHRCVRSWKWCQLASQAPFHCLPGARLPRLKWSPDGSRLVMAAFGATTILSFGGSAVLAASD